MSAALSLCFALGLYVYLAETYGIQVEAPPPCPACPGCPLNDTTPPYREGLLAGFLLGSVSVAIIVYVIATEKVAKKEETRKPGR